MGEHFFLSVVVPVYNTEKYLSSCIEGLICASLKSVQIILVDDGSADHSFQICQAYEQKYPYIKVCQQKNAGPSTARNRGIDVAEGEYIMFLDSDDVICPAVLFEHVQLLNKNKSDIWASDFHRVADNGCILDRVYQIDETEKPITDRSYLANYLGAKDCVWNVWRYIFRRQFLIENKLRFAEGFNIGEDLEFVVRALSVCSTIGFYHKPFYNYRVNYGVTLTRRCTSQKAIQLMEMLQQAMKHLGHSPEARLLKMKLAREYILNLSILCEVPAEDNDTTFTALKKASWLMKEATGVYAIAAKLTAIVGIPTASRLLYCMKRVKRFKRAIKMRNYGG